MCCVSVFFACCSFLVCVVVVVFVVEGTHIDYSGISRQRQLRGAYRMPRSARQSAVERAGLWHCQW